MANGVDPLVCVYHTYLPTPRLFGHTENKCTHAYVRCFKPGGKFVSAACYVRLLIQLIYGVVTRVLLLLFSIFCIVAC